ncbi:MAG: Ppx/GppA family phosphatase [Pseudomonadota bacterium]
MSERDGDGPGTADLLPKTRSPARSKARVGQRGVLPAVAGGAAVAARAVVASPRQPSLVPTAAARSFAAPGTREGRVAVVDAGSNSVRLVVYEGASRAPAVVFNEKVMCGLGAALADTGHLSPEGRERALRALGRFAAVAEHLHVATLAGVATAAIREAADGRAFRAEVARRTGIRLKVASGADESRLAASGVLYGNPAAEGVVVDLGGASMELCPVSGGRPGTGVTTPLGPLRLAREADPGRAIAAALAKIGPSLRRPGLRLFLVGGAWRALARADIERRRYPLKVLHEYTLSGAEARDLARFAAGSTPAGLAALDGVSENRAAAMPMAGRLLRGLVEALAPASVAISAFGLREGVVYEAMAPGLRAEDPLLAAAAEMERLHGRAPGFGAELGAWVTGVMTPNDARERRLMLTACLLADVNWRTHPDHRHQACWEAATRVALTDLGHDGRVLLATALAARYRRPKSATPETEVAELVTPDALSRALALGLGMRLGCTLAAASPGLLRHCRVEGGGGRFRLILDGPARELSGEDVDKRFAQFARALGVESDGVMAA